MNNLIVTERQNGFITVLDLDGRIMLGNDCQKLRDAFSLLSQKGEKRVLLNMAKVFHIDSSGLGELVRGYTTLEKNEGEMKLFHLTPRVKELMEITRLLNVFEVYESETEAINSFHNSSLYGSSKDIEGEQNSYVTGKLDQALVNF